mmetsp:Transcript_20286/g.56433  ORF Transcript_20286/g.56433 Transcript_20286/m.56433 type:complete len:230 (-) Transcript_20286:31-720(-)
MKTRRMGCDGMQDGFSVNGWPPRPRKVLAAFRFMQRETMLFELHPNGGDAATIIEMIAPMIGGTRHGTAKHGTAKHGTARHWCDETIARVWHYGRRGRRSRGTHCSLESIKQTNKQEERNGTRVAERKSLIPIVRIHHHSSMARVRRSMYSLPQTRHLQGSYPSEKHSKPKSPPPTHFLLDLARRKAWRTLFKPTRAVVHFRVLFTVVPKKHLPRSWSFRTLTTVHASY